MTATARVYPKAVVDAWSKKIDLLADTLKVMLLGAGYTPSDAHEFVSDVRAYELAAGGGYTTGGATLTSKTLAYTQANSWATARANTTAYAVGDVVRPAAPNGYLYRCIVAGNSGAAPPAWSTTLGQDTVDGTVTWNLVGTGFIAFGAANVSWTIAAGTTITAAYAVLYDDTPGTDVTKPMIDLQTYTPAETAGGSGGGTFQVTWPSLGIFVHFSVW